MSYADLKSFVTDVNRLANDALNALSNLSPGEPDRDFEEAWDAVKKICDMTKMGDRTK